MQVTLPLNLAGLEDGVVTIVALFVELAILSVLLVTGGPALLEAGKELFMVGIFP